MPRRCYLCSRYVWPWQRRGWLMTFTPAPAGAVTEQRVWHVRCGRVR